MIKNRIEKKWKKLKPWADRNKIEAFRLYDHDIPEFPFYIDKYGEYFLIYDRTDTRDIGKNQLPQVLTALKELFGSGDDKLILKKRERQKGEQQYEKMDSTENFFWIQESQARLEVNLWDYLDTGVFLDHRPMRQKIFKQAPGKKFLNLFCYTGSVSVFAALAGAQTTSVDMSATYIDWTKRNFVGNKLPFTNHNFIQENCLEYLETPATEKYDLIFLDPPTFSNSKRMNGTFEVERDQEQLVENCMKRLTPEGTLYFSNNMQKFKVAPTLVERFEIQNITPETIPQDYQNQKIHNVHQITHKK